VLFGANPKAYNMGPLRFWFAHCAEVTLREQLVTQVILGILCHDLHPGERLPSTRELARRFRLHPNTISAGYRQLKQERWIEFRHGSGVYVREAKPDVPLSPALVLDQLLANLFRCARGLGVPLSTLRHVFTTAGNFSRLTIFSSLNRQKI
jgi:DNA-binding transcriptional regulator YhcF (GntR family)